MTGTDIEAPEEASPESAGVGASDEKQAPENLASLRELFSFGPTEKKLYIATGVFCAVVSGCVFPAMAFFFAKSFEDLGAAADSEDFLDNIRSLCYTFMVLGVVAGVFMTAQATLLETAAGMMTNDFKTSWFEALLRQDMAYHDIKDVAGDASVISTNARKYKKGLGRKFGEGIQFTMTFFGGLGYAFYASWKSSLVILTCVPFMAVAVTFLLKMNQSQSTRAQETYAEAGTIVYTTVSAIRTVLSLNAVESMVRKFVAATEKAYRGAVKQLNLVGLANGSVMGSFLLSYIAVALFGSYLLYDSVRNSGCDPSGTVPGVDSCNPSGMDVFGSLMGVMFAASVLPQVTVSIEAMSGARAACYPAIVAMNRKVNSDKEVEIATEAKEGMECKKEIPLPKYVIDSSSPGGKKPSSIEGEIRFKDVKFAYPTRPETDVFKEFTLTVKAGMTVALVGPSGSGKSTTVQLIERFYDPKDGCITVDGIDLRELNVKWLRSQIGLVSQEPNLFAKSIRENIAYGCPGATQKQIEDAAKLANAHDFISSFADGYDTQVGNKGTHLSGGQKQRIAIARVLVSNPKILLLDEATSALDSESESIVQDALDHLLESGNRTTVVIAHRLSTIRNADLIAVVEAGKVIETGTHNELLQSKGHYYDLVETQKGRTNDNSDSTPSSRSQSAVDLTALGTDVEKPPILRFHDVHFSYPARPDNEIFRGLNLSLHEGETLALVGPSGGGKSTVIQLVERFYDPASGSIELDGIDLKDLNVKWLRDNVGLVSQEPTLFNTTIAENIKYGCPDATLDEIEVAARQANAHDFIMSFPNNYNTLVGEGGTQVSGGQKQRIAIARAILKKPRILCLDEATSALDSESERLVQEALDKIMSSEAQATIVIAHRLSTVRNADRIAVISKGKVREVGTHDELMAKPDGQYRRLQDLQNLEQDQSELSRNKSDVKRNLLESGKKSETTDTAADDEEAPDKDKEKEIARRARLLAKNDVNFFLIGTVGAILAGLVFPAWGVIFAYMIELLYTPVAPCEDGVMPLPPPYEDLSCAEYFDVVADDMQEKSYKIAYGCLGIIAAAMIGNVLLYYGFGTASEKMNKRVRDAAFTSLARQEIAYFDVRSVGSITSQLQEDTAMLHAFSGQPIRTLTMSLSSVLVGLVLSFVYMWPFALLTLAILPFMAFGAEAEMQMYLGEDEGGAVNEDENSPGGIVVESLLNIRTVAALTIEEQRSAEFAEALRKEDPRPLRSNLVKGSTSGLGQFIQMWGVALMFWWGGWLLYKYPNEFSFRDFLISMFSLLFSLSGLATAAQGATDRDKAKAAADRVFELTDRESAIDPLSDEGKKGV